MHIVRTYGYGKPEQTGTNTVLSKLAELSALRGLVGSTAVKLVSRACGIQRKAE